MEREGVDRVKREDIRVGRVKVGGWERGSG